MRIVDDTLGASEDLMVEMWKSDWRLNTVAVEWFQIHLRPLLQRELRELDAAENVETVIERFLRAS